MKTFFTSSLIATILAFTSCGPGSFQGAEYSNKIVNEQVKVTDKYNAFMIAVNDTSVNASANNKKNLKILLDQISESKNTVKNMEKFDGSSEFADSCLSQFSVFEDAAKNEYTEILTIYDGVYDDAAAEKSGALFKSAEEKIDASLLSFSKSQESFAKKYNITLQE